MTREPNRGASPRWIGGLVVVLVVATAAARPSPRPRMDDVDAPAAEGFGAMTANDWLGRVDRDDYQGSYDTAATPFQRATTPEAWATKLRAMRRPLGKMLSRKAGAASVERSLPGLSDGLYVVVEFDSAFERRKTCVEVVTVMQEPDGALKVVRYAIQPRPRLPRDRPPPPTGGRLPGG